MWETYLSEANIMKGQLAVHQARMQNDRWDKKTPEWTTSISGGKAKEEKEI